MLVAAAGAALAGCASGTRGGAGGGAGGEAGGAARGEAAGYVEREVLLDGNTEDWPDGLVAIANEHHLFFRFSVAGEPFAIQAADTTVAILLDVDADASTGRRLPGRLGTLGIDLEMQASPTKPEGGAGMGLGVMSVDASGFRLPLSRADFDASFAPTYASTWYEARISRTPENPGNLPTKGMLSSGVVRGVFARLDGNGRLIGASEPFVVPVGSVCAGGGRAMFALPPSKPEGAVRVMSYNVLRNGPQSRPEQFRRVLGVLKPDVILFQEWDEGEAREIAAWLDSVDAPGGAGGGASGSRWTVIEAAGDLSSGGGVLVASRLPASSGFERPKAEGREVRAVAATIDTPLGVMLACSVHLKCCGTSNGPEDQRRMAEARAINEAFDRVAGTSKAVVRVIGGDMNLVGTRPPLDALRRGIDVDGTDLSVAEAKVLGESLVETWTEADAAFGPGRLDYVVYSDASVRAANAFVFDTRRLAPDALVRMGLDAEDSAASDHLPVVVDLVKR